MEVRKGRRRSGGGESLAVVVFKAAPRLLICFFLCLLSVCSSPVVGVGTGSDSSDIRHPTGRRTYSNILAEETRRSRSAAEVATAMPRRYLSGPGSYPPRCTSKCGKCTPCRPVHVPVPPGVPVTTEYYPEAWRCKCGNRLYMP